MQQGLFYFIDDNYYDIFTDPQIMKNKENTDGIITARPFFFAVKDVDNEDILWLVPVSSQYEKFIKIYKKNVNKYGYCDILDFGEVLGRKAAFLIQNIIPITDKYILQPYIQKSTGLYVKIDNPTALRITNKVKSVLAKHKQGIKLIFPNIDYIKAELIKELSFVREG